MDKFREIISYTYIIDFGFDLLIVLMGVFTYNVRMFILFFSCNLIWFLG